ncbi:response regulator [Zavarzinella formosa]|uniref:response regulator n=1 Tax=Zavarzinella formosa TaxID=360055 RepID=UPI0003790F21|nr:response regulator [Zavarzinella formosa]
MSVDFLKSPLPTVMVIDDYPDAAESMALLLRTHGYDASVALTSHEALETNPVPDAVILELRLRDSDGCELVRSLREKAGETDPTFIAVTTCGRPEDFDRSARAGISAHLVKPANVDDVLSALSHVSFEHTWRY